MLLSIVIPVYNVEPYLEECLSSVVGQTIDPATYEILLVDDKSTDNSLAICNDFAAKHANIRVFPLPENTPGGAGFPSNLGIRNAKGKYIGFVDSDDYAAPTMFAELLTEAGRTNADITICSYSLLQVKDGSSIPPDDLKGWTNVADPAFDDLPLAEKKMRCLRLCAVPWRKLYRREFLAKNRIQYPVGNFFYEDMSLHWFSVVLAEKIARIDRRLITHRIQRAGQTVSEDIGRMTSQMAEHIKIIREFLLNKNLLETYLVPFWRQALLVVALVPPDHPMRGEVTQRIADICGPAPEGILEQLDWGTV